MITLIQRFNCALRFHSWSRWELASATRHIDRKMIQVTIQRRECIHCNFHQFKNLA